MELVAIAHDSLHLNPRRHGSGDGGNGRQHRSHTIILGQIEPDARIDENLLCHADTVCSSTPPALSAAFARDNDSRAYYQSAASAGSSRTWLGRDLVSISDRR